MKPNAPNVIERSIYWKRYVAANTRDPRQKARCLASIERLEAELSAALLMERAKIGKQESQQ